MAGSVVYCLIGTLEKIKLTESIILEPLLSLHTMQKGLLSPEILAFL